MKIKKLKLKSIIAVVVVLAIVFVGLSVLIVTSLKDEKIDSAIAVYGSMQNLKSNFQKTDSAATLDGYEPAAETSEMVLFINPQNANIAVLNKVQDKIWYGAISENDPNIEKTVNQDEALAMLSQIVVTGTDEAGNKKTLTSHEFSTTKNTFSINNIENGVRVDYLLSDSPKVKLIPKALTEERFNELSSKMSGDNASIFKQSYSLLEFDKLRQEQKDKILKEYPDAKTTKMYLSFDETREFKIKQIEQALESIGYTFEQLEADEKAVGRISGASEQIAFKIPVEFKLENGIFVASIIKEDIKYTSKMTATTVSLLPYFGATTEQSEGYMVVPDGSGALIELNSRNSKTLPFTGAVYGVEEINQPTWTKEKIIPIVLPVFGVKEFDNAFIADISHGAALAEIGANISGAGNPYNRIGTTFTIKKTDSYPIYSSAEQTINISLLQAGDLKDTFTVEYTFLHGDDANYSGMAKAYQNKLLQQGVLKALNDQTDPIHILNAYGLIDAKESHFGIPVDVKRTLTSADDVKKMMNYFNEHTKNNPIVNYIGTFNGGIKHSVANKVNFEKNLGGLNGMKSLTQYAKEKQNELFFNTSLSMVEKDAYFDGFTPSKDSSYFINKKYGMVYEAEAATFYHSADPRYVLSPTRLLDITSGFCKQISKISPTGVSLRHIGKSLNGDFNVDNPIYRDQAIEYHQNALKTIKDYNLKTMISQGNLYAVGFADYISQLPLRSSNHPIQTRSIPFVQMVFHGYISFTGSILNDVSDVDNTVLRSIEYGSGVNSSFIMSDYGELKGTSYDYLKSSNFDARKEISRDSYNRVYEALSGLNNQTINAHAQLAENVYITEYSNNVAIIVNYRDVDFDYNGNIIKAHNFIRTEVQ